MIKFILTVSILLLSYVGFGQSADLFTINKKNISITEAINFIEKKSPYTFWYRSDIPHKSKYIKLSANNASIEKLMELCTEGQPFTYQKISNVIVLRPDSNFEKLPFTKDGVFNAVNSKNAFVTDGYSQLDSRNLTSSISTLTGTDINRLNTGSLFDNTNVSGLQINNNAKGSNNSMLIRGRNSLTAGTDPLVMLDGVPYSGDINQIDRTNIQSINILKDAGATAIYGSRGGNGVIVITTKKASFIDDRPILSLNSIVVKDGFIFYKNANGYNILDQMFKQYAVKLTFKGKFPSGSYIGKVPSDISLDEMTAIMKACGIVLLKE